MTGIDITPEARDYYIQTLRTRYEGLTPRERKRLYQLDSLLSVSVRRLTVGQGTDPGAPDGPLPHEGLDTPKPRKSPWFWPLWALTGLLVVVLVGTTLSLILT